MSWITPTETHVKEAISGPELEALRAAALADGQADPVEGIMDRVTSRVRREVATCAQNNLGAAGAIPESLLDAWKALVVWAIMQRPAAAIIDDENESRAKAVTRAERLLERVAACKFAIEEPEEIGDETTSTPSPSMTAPSRNFEDADQDGI